jgi:hypothetical protein
VTYTLKAKHVEKVEPVLDDAYKYWASAETAAAAMPNALTAVQTMAGRWQTAITAILGILAVAALIGGREVLQQLPKWAQFWVGTLAALAVLTSASASFFFGHSSASIPKVQQEWSPDDLANADLTPLRQAQHAARYFLLALLCAFSSLVFTMVSVGFVWFPSSAASSAKVEMQVMGADGRSQSLCGKVSIDRNSGAVTISPGDGGARSTTYPPNQVVDIHDC